MVMQLINKIGFSNIVDKAFPQGKNNRALIRTQDGVHLIL